ncbi:MAG: GAF domain-containing protein, partial [Chloroflexi bacterium]|nr:GAF domain-containing protein [Chloroflexota bacterium]
MGKPCLTVLWVNYRDLHFSELVESLEKNSNFRIDLAGSNERALHLLTTSKELYDVVLIDARPLEEAGVELAQCLHKDWPDFECILLIERGGELRRQALKLGVFRTFEDPIRPEDLLMNLRVAAIHSRQRRIMRAILSETNFNKVLDGILDTAAALVEADEACLMIKEPESDRLHRYPASHPGQVHCKRIFKGVDLCRDILRTGNVVAVPDAQLDPRVDDRFAATGIRSFAAVPANFNNQRVGVLYAFYRTPRDFERQGLIPLLNAPAQLAGQAITNLRHFARTRSQSNYMTSLIATSQALTQAQTDEEQFDLAWKYASTQLKISTFFIGLYDPKTDSIHYEMVYDRGEPGHLEDRFLGNQRHEWGVSGLVAKTGEEMYWSTYEEGARICQQQHIQPLQVGTPCQSCFYLPLKKGDEVLGVISIQSYIPYAFDDAIKDAFRALGSLLVVGMEKNRLYKEVANARDEVDQVARKLTEESYEASLKAIVAAVRKVMSCDSVALYGYNQDRDEFEFPPTLLGVNDSTSVMALRRVSKRSIIY